MLAAYLNSLRESFNRRMGLILIGLAVVLAISFNMIVHIKPLPNGMSMVLFGQKMLGPGSLATPALLITEVRIVGIGASVLFWVLLSILATAPLLASTLDRGWLELTLSKGVSRWEIFLGRYLGGVTLYLLSVIIATVPLAIRVQIMTGEKIWVLFPALLIETFAFASLLSLAALGSVPQMGAAPPILLSLVVSIISPILAFRQQGIYQLLTSNTSHFIVDWMYRILPKTSELDGMCTDFIQEHHVVSWYPFWSTGIFTVVVLALTLWLLHRKSL
jgi:ABC-type transport system involved in multi-copper enzyme maturation permease subunit